MAQRKPGTKAAQKPAKTTKATGKRFEGFSDVEKAAMKQRVKEMKAAADEADGEKAVLARIADMPEQDRALAKRLHAIVKTSAPGLSPRLWYGMPAYAKDGKLVCHFQDARKFKTRYATIGFSDAAKLDDGVIWPVAYALTEWTDAAEAKVRALLKKAVG